MSRLYSPAIFAAAFLAVACAHASSLHSSPVAAAAAAPLQAFDSTGGNREKAGQNIFQPGPEGAAYRSVGLREVGLGPKGVVMGHWTLVFRGGLVSWHHSDVVERARYEVGADGAITSPIGNPPDRPVRAQYDGRTDRIFWLGLWYERVAPDRQDSEVGKPQ